MRSNREFVAGVCTTLTVGSVLAIGGCQQLSTYPPVEVTAKMQRPDAEPVPTIVAESVSYARHHYLKGEILPLNLPAAMPAVVYDKAFVHLNESESLSPASKELLRPMIFPDEPAIHITEIRTRAMTAQVDMMYPSGSFLQFVTLSLERGMLEGWKVKSERRWVMRDLKAPAPNFVPAPVEDPIQKMARTPRR